MSGQPVRITAERPPPPRYIPGKCYALADARHIKVMAEFLTDYERKAA